MSNPPKCQTQHHGITKLLFHVRSGCITGDYQDEGRDHQNMTDKEKQKLLKEKQKADKEKEKAEQKAAQEKKKAEEKLKKEI